MSITKAYSADCLNISFVGSSVRLRAYCARHNQMSKHRPHHDLHAWFCNLPGTETAVGGGHVVKAKHLAEKLGELFNGCLPCPFEKVKPDSQFRYPQVVQLIEASAQRRSTPIIPKDVGSLHGGNRESAAYAEHEVCGWFWDVVAAHVDARVLSHLPKPYNAKK